MYAHLLLLHRNPQPSTSIATSVCLGDGVAEGSGAFCSVGVQSMAKITSVRAPNTTDEVCKGPGEKVGNIGSGRTLGAVVMLSLWLSLPPSTYVDPSSTPLYLVPSLVYYSAAIILLKSQEGLQART